MEDVLYKINYESFVQICEDVYWVGNHNSIPLHTNPYLLVIDDNAILFDPGGVNDFSVVTQKILNIIDINQIKYIVLHHEDPDVCGMTHFLEEIIGSVDVVTNSYSEILLRNYGIEARFIEINDEPTVSMFKKIGIEFIKTPFLHSPGAFMTYVEPHKILFSSDIFGWIGEKERDIFSQNVTKEDYIFWHSKIVPSIKLLKPLIGRLRKLDIRIIASQHGGIIEGREKIEDLFNLLEGLDYLLN